MLTAGVHKKAMEQAVSDNTDQEAADGKQACVFPSASLCQLYQEADNHRVNRKHTTSHS